MENTSTTPASDSTPSTVNDAAAALAYADSSLATPATPADTTPAAAVTPPAEGTVPASEQVTDDPRSPFIPRARFDEVNTQKNQLTEQLKQYERFKDLQPNELQGVSNIALGLKSDAVGTVAGLVDMLLANPALGPVLQARLAPHAGRWLAGQRGKVAEPAADPEPEADLQAPDGTLVFSAARQKEWREWNNRQLTSQFEAKLQPLQHVAQAFQDSQHTAAYTNTVSSVIAELSQGDPAFAEHKQAVGTVIQNDPELLRMALGDAQMPANPRLAIRYAWREVQATQLFPQQLKSAGARELANHQQRAVAAVTNPASANTTSPKPTVGDARAALEYANQQLGAA